jgi:hypothetical protein
VITAGLTVTAPARTAAARPDQGTIDAERTTVPAPGPDSARSDAERPRSWQPRLMTRDDLLALLAALRTARVG